MKFIKIFKIIKIFFLIIKKVFIKNTPEKLQYPDLNYFKKIKQTRIKKITENYKIKKKPISLIEDKDNKFMRKKFLFKNYLITTQNKNFFMFNGFVFFNKTFFYEKSQLPFGHNKKELYFKSFKEIIENSSFFYNNKIISKNLDTKKITIKKTLVCLSTYFNRSYFHWMNMPGLIILKYLKNTQDLEFYVEKKKQILPKYAKQTLKNLNLQNIKFDKNIKYFAKEIKFCLQEIPSINISKKHILWLRKKFLYRIKKYKKKQYIFISRKNSTRNILNENQVFNFLKKINPNFKKLSLDNLTVAKQVETFNNAEVIIATYGAALTNLCFCRKGTKVLEIFPKNNVNPLFHIISDICNLRYFYIKGSNQNFFDQSFYISIDKFSKIIKKMSI